MNIKCCTLAFNKRVPFCFQFCQICRKGDNEELLLLCDGCDRGYHTYCCTVSCMSCVFIYRFVDHLGGFWNYMIQSSIQGQAHRIILWHKSASPALHLVSYNINWSLGKREYKREPNSSWNLRLSYLASECQHEGSVLALTSLVAWSSLSLSLVIGLNKVLSVKFKAVAPQMMTSDVSQFKNFKTGWLE